MFNEGTPTEEGMDFNIDKEKFQKAITEYLDCPCEFFDATVDESSFIPYLEEARKKRLANGFTPVLICMRLADQVAFWENRPFSKWDDERFEQIKAEACDRKNELLKQKYETNLEIRKQFDKMYDSNIELLIPYKEYYDRYKNKPLDYGSFISYWDGITRNPCKTYNMILAEIPTRKPYEVFAWMPFEGCEGIPNSDEFMRMFKYFYEEYGVEPVIVQSDTIECVIAKTLTCDEAKRLAKDIIGWDLGAIELYKLEERLAESLMKDKRIWFWWD